MSWNSWSWRWCAWVLAARGYAVLLPNPRLSTGYGHNHVASSWGDWATLPATDIQSTDVNVAVWSDNELLGELRLSRGSVDWRPAHHQAVWTMEWERFDEVMRANGRRS